MQNAPMLAVVVTVGLDLHTTMDAGDTEPVTRGGEGDGAGHWAPPLPGRKDSTSDPARSNMGLFTPTMEEMMSWDTDEKGNIKLNPLLGFQGATAAGMACLLRIQYAEVDQDIGTPGKALQLGMTPRQAFELAQDLLRISAAANSAPTAGSA